MLTLLFTLLLSTSAPAPELPDAVVEPLITRSVVDNDRVSLTVANLEMEPTLIMLSGFDTDAVHFSQRVKDHNGYSIGLSLKDLPAGRYVISVKKGDTIRQQVIRKTEAGILCSTWK